MRKKRQYLEIQQIIFREDGWTNKKQEEFIDKYLELLDSYGKDKLQCIGSWRMTTEEELDNDELKK